MSIQITETPSEYLLTIPIDQKERAKSIDGRRWDPDRKVWIYPKTKKTYDSLIAEFGDIISRKDAKTLSPKLDEPKVKADQTTDLKAELQAIKDTLGSLRNPAEPKLKEEMLALSTELARTKAELKSEKAKIEILEANLSSKDSRLKDVLATNASQQKTTGTPFMSLLIEHAKKASQYNKDFIEILERSKIDSSLPIEISKSLEKNLRRSLSMSTGSIFELLSTARDAELLSEEALDFAHTIRRQRNIVAHSDVSQEETLARILVVLYAAALLWPRLPK